MVITVIKALLIVAVYSVAYSTLLLLFLLGFLILVHRLELSVVHLKDTADNTVQSTTLSSTNFAVWFKAIHAMCRARRAEKNDGPELVHRELIIVDKEGLSALSLFAKHTLATLYAWAGICAWVLGLINYLSLAKVANNIAEISPVVITTYSLIPLGSLFLSLIASLCRDHYRRKIEEAHTYMRAEAAIFTSIMEVAAQMDREHRSIDANIVVQARGVLPKDAASKILFKLQILSAKSLTYSESLEIVAELVTELAMRDDWHQLDGKTRNTIIAVQKFLSEKGVI